MALIDIGQMSYLKGDVSKAKEYAQMAFSIAEKEGMHGLYTLIHLLYGDISHSTGDLVAAKELYNKAIEWSKFTDSGTLTLAYLKYGRYYEETGNPVEAEKRYNEGLSISFKHQNMECRKDLMKSISRVKHARGKDDSAITWLDRYQQHLDSISLATKEREFSNLLLKYQEIKYENELQSKELELLRSNKQKIVISFILSIIAAILILTYYLYGKQKKTYRLLVEHHRKYVEQFNLKSATSAFVQTDSNANKETKEDTSADKELFTKVEGLMRIRKIFKQKEITRESVSEMLGTNRTYLSRAINAYSGKSFNNYINTYRINEAVTIISGNGADIPLKQLADELGFGSVSVFYKVFERETGCSVSRYKKELFSSERAKIG